MLHDISALGISVDIKGLSAAKCVLAVSELKGQCYIAGYARIAC